MMHEDEHCAYMGNGKIDDSPLKISVEDHNVDYDLRGTGNATGNFLYVF